MTSNAPVALFGHWICPFSVRVEFALAQRAIAYEVVDVPPSAARPKGFVVPDEFVAHSPKLEIPMVRIEGEYLADSMPILWWLEERFIERSLVPAGATEELRKRMAWIDRHVYRPMIGVYYGTEPDDIAVASQRFGDAMMQLTEWLEGTEWLCGGEPSLCEALMVAVYVRLDGLRRLGLGGTLPEAVAAHHERCSQVPGWAAVAWSPEQTDEFVWRFSEYRRRRSPHHWPGGGDG